LLRAAKGTAGVFPETYGAPFHFQRVEEQQAAAQAFADAFSRAIREVSPATGRK
jgi:hypothetical protein